MKTNKNIDYYISWHKWITIPAGVAVTPTDNQPPPVRYWVLPWQGMPTWLSGFASCEGFLIDAVDVSE